ncbi:MAG: hypothetical protein JRJ19_00090 [Deltaproteobacteria bacterium]|nr:hypothetical protein [Deltaproteobacteria bacterium]
MAEGAKMLQVYTIVEKQGSDKSFWVKVGAGFPNRDGSINVYLDALPTNGRLQIREKFAEPDAD